VELNGVLGAGCLSEMCCCGVRGAVVLVLLWCWYCCGAGTAVVLVLL
jgi:hypothetical protein